MGPHHQKEPLTFSFPGIEKVRKSMKISLCRWHFQLRSSWSGSSEVGRGTWLHSSIAKTDITNHRYPIIQGEFSNFMSPYIPQDDPIWLSLFSGIITWWRV